DKAPELELEPVEVLLAALLHPVAGPTGALERVESQVGDVRDVYLGLVAKPALRLVDEAELVVVDADRADGALATVEARVAGRGALAGDHGRLVVAVEMVLVGTVAELDAREQLLGDVRVAGGRDRKSTRL